jgi:hypothetical protein
LNERQSDHLNREHARRSPRLAGLSTSWHLVLLLAALCPLFLLAGCEEEAGPLPLNTTPSTYLQVQGADLDTVDYRQILNWWGSDPDGSVIGYCIRWDGEWEPPADAIRCAFDNTFMFTTVTTDTFVVPISGAYGERTFAVRAVDDDRNVDPVGKSQVFKLSNWPPELGWSTLLGRPTVSLPAVSFAWTSQDLDGRDTVREYRYWLDSDTETDTVVTADTLIALGVNDFDGRFGKRTLFVQAFDEALAPSNRIEHTWSVDPPPTERYLLIDNVSSDTPGESTEDGYYRALLDSVAPGDYFVYDVQLRGDFRSDREVAPLLSLFEGVLWYGGNRREENDASVRANLDNAESGILTYLGQGGNILLAYRDVIGDGGGLSEEFASEVLGVEEYFKDAAGTSNIRLASRAHIVTSLVSPPADTLETTSSSPDAEFFRLNDDVEPLFWVEPGYFDSTVTPDQTAERAYLGVASDHEEGRIGLVTYLLSRSDGLGNAGAIGVALLRDILGL